MPWIVQWYGILARLGEHEAVLVAGLEVGGDRAELAAESEMMSWSLRPRLTHTTSVPGATRSLCGSNRLSAALTVTVSDGGSGCSPGSLESGIAVVTAAAAPSTRSAVGPAGAGTVVGAASDERRTTRPRRTNGHASRAARLFTCAEPTSSSSRLSAVGVEGGEGDRGQGDGVHRRPDAVQIEGDEGDDDGDGRADAHGSTVDERPHDKHLDAPAS